MNEKKWDTDWLIFSAKTRRGAIIFLLFFIFSGLMARYLFNAMNSSKAELRYFSILEDDPIRLDTLVSQKNVFNKTSKKSKTVQVPDSLFNPNDFELDNWMKLGLSAKQAASALRFKESIGGFKSKKDLAKVYGINDEVYAQLYPLIDLPDSMPQTKNTAKKKFKVNINRASIKQLQFLNGIGPFYAARILEYRDMLGGFYDFNQLMEINKMPKELVDTIAIQAYPLREQDLIKMNLNEVTIEQLLKHPYIRISVAREIVRSRDFLDGFDEVEQLLKLDLIDEELFLKLKPYFKIEK